MFIWQCLTHRSIVGLSRELAEPYWASGLENLPQDGSFVLAVNHTTVRWTPRLLASIHKATLERRPELAGEWLVVVGNRELRQERLRPWARPIAVRIRQGFERVYDLWNYNCLRLPMGNERVSPKALREWRTRAKTQPSIVFPEGRGATTFKEIRPGAGRWLATFDVPTIPLAVWWDEPKNGWVFDFGPAIEWASQSSLHDVQLGLALAEALPPAEAPDWQPALSRWRKAHSEVWNVP